MCRFYPIESLTEKKRMQIKGLSDEALEQAINLWSKADELSLNYEREFKRRGK